MAKKKGEEKEKKMFFANLQNFLVINGTYSAYVNDAVAFLDTY